MSINSRNYENLKLSQRFIATCGALRRGNIEGAEKIVHIHSRKVYRSPKLDFEEVLHTAIALECDLLEQALWIILAVCRNDDNSVCIHLNHMFDLEGNWLTYLEDLGISEEHMPKLPRNYIVTMLLAKVLPPNLILFREYLMEIKQCIYMGEIVKKAI